MEENKENPFSDFNADTTHNVAAPNLADLIFRNLILVVDSTTPIQRISPAALAYLGDAVFELYVRTYYIFPPKRQQLYHHQVVAQVRAETQAQHLRSLEPHLDSSELEIIRRGRNAASGRFKRVSSDIYQQASGLETLIGYLYLTNPQRLAHLLAQLTLLPAEESRDQKL